VLSFVKREPSAVLLAGQLAGVLLYPFMEGSDVGRALFSLFGIAILGLVVLAVRATPSLTWIAVLVGIPATVLLLIQAVTGAVISFLLCGWFLRRRLSLSRSRCAWEGKGDRGRGSTGLGFEGSWAARSVLPEPAAAAGPARCCGLVGWHGGPRELKGTGLFFFPEPAQ
jgi:hypothetical protein